MTMASPKIRTTVTHQQLLDTLSYDPITGIFTWKNPPRNKLKIGDKAGHFKKNGYGIIKLFGKQYKLHRLAWFYMTKEWPPIDIDHWNLNASDNSFENLRLATESQNRANAAIQKNNTSGFKGVSFKEGRWVAIIGVSKVKKHLGYFGTPEEASSAYISAAKKHFKEFARW